MKSCMRQKNKIKVRVVLKLDFEKAYDKINCDFLIQCLEKIGFNSTWCKWINKLLHDGTVSMKMNNEIGPYFTIHKGVRQGEPLSPLLFNFVVHVLTRMVLSAQQHGLVIGMIDHLISNCVAILQYVDDTIIFLENSVEKLET
jgi:hypothetical protein